MRALLIAAIVAAGLGCGASTAPEAAPEALVVPVFVDDAPAGEVRLPPGPGPWPLLEHLPDGVPAYGSWTRLTVEGAAGRVFTRRDPGRAGGEEPRFFRRPEDVAFAVFLVVPDDAPKALKLRAERPALTVPTPTAVRVRTFAPLARGVQSPLRTKRDGRAASELTDAEIAGLTPVAEPGRPAHVGAVRLAEVVALRVPLDRVASVTLRSPSGEAVVPRAELDDDVLKATRRGSWVYKGFEAGERTATLREVEELDIATTD